MSYNFLIPVLIMGKFKLHKSVKKKKRVGKIRNVNKRFRGSNLKPKETHIHIHNHGNMVKRVEPHKSAVVERHIYSVAAPQQIPVVPPIPVRPPREDDEITQTDDRSYITPASMINYDNLNKKTLQSMATARGLKGRGFWNLNKAGLVSLLRGEETQQETQEY